MHKKNSTKIAALIVCIVMMLAVLTSCSAKLSGTYVHHGIIDETITFSGDHVTMSAFGLDINGTYEIKGDTITVSFSVLGMEQSVSWSFERNGNSIYIDGAEYVKE